MVENPEGNVLWKPWWGVHDNGRGLGDDKSVTILVGKAKDLQDLNVHRNYNFQKCHFQQVFDQLTLFCVLRNWFL